VRRAACTNFGKIVKQISAELALSTLMQPFKALALDSHDSVRLHAVPLCIDFGSILDSTSRAAVLFPIVKSLCSDDCWRVRYMAADKFRELCDAVSSVPDSMSVLIDCYVSMLQDTEAEVRTAAASRVSEVSRLFESNIIVSRIIPAVISLASDPSQFARSALATNVMGLCSLLEPAQASELLVPLFLKLLKDEFPEVRLNIISKLDAVGSIIGLDQLSRSLMPAIIDLACDRKWRVRLTVIQHVPHLAKELGVELFEQRLSEICMAWMVDEVFSVREAATKNMTELIKVFGPEWAISYVAPRIKDMTSNTNYLHRMTALYTTSDFAESIRNQKLTEHMLPIVVGMLTDPVPNIRFNVAKTLEVILKTRIVSPSAIKATIEPALMTLMRDVDQDVRYFAQRAAKQIDPEHKSIT
jgi:serine/threonine-protein phosphatase 2A regulatory subunit A